MTARTRASLALVASMVLFAMSYTVTKVALVDLGPFTLGALRFLLATAFIAGLVTVRGGWERPTPADGRRLVLGGLLGVTLYFALENLGVSWARASDATMLSAVFPAVIALVDVATRGVRIGPRGWAGIALAVGGSVPIVLGAPPAASGVDESRRLWGCLLILLAGVAWAFYTNVTRDVVGRYSSWTTVLWQDGAGAVAFVPLALVEAPSWHRPSHPVATASSVLALTLLCSVLAMVCYAAAVRHLPTAVVATSINLVPIFGVVIALVVLHEGVSPWQVVGCLVVVGGVVVSHRD